MTARERLEDIFARAIHSDRWPNSPWSITREEIRDEYRRSARAIIAAAEREGFQFAVLETTWIAPNP